MRVRVLSVSALALSLGLASVLSLAQERAPRQAPTPREVMTPRDTPPPAAAGTPSAGGRGHHPGPAHVTVEPRRPSGNLRLAQVNVMPGTRVVIPPRWPRLRTLPNAAFWGVRDLEAEIRWLSRRGFIPVTPVDDGVEMLSDYAQMPAGWRAYGFGVPAGGTLQVEVQHDKLGWFRLMMVDKWGTPGPGMLQAAMAPRPVLVTYKNPSKEAQGVYIIVDDPGWWSDATHPYTLVVRRDWAPNPPELKDLKMVAGLWGVSPSVSAEFRGRSLTGPGVYPR